MIPKETNTSEAPSITTQKFLASKEYKTKGKNGQIYILKIFQTEKEIIFHVKEEEDISDISYTKTSNIDEFYNINRYFKQFESVEELFSIVFKELKESEIIINKKDNKLNLDLIFEIRGEKKIFPFILNPEQPKINNVVINLCQKVKEIDELKKEIKNLKIINENYKKEIEKNNKKFENFEKIISDLKNEINVLYKGFEINPDILEKFKNTEISHIIRFNELGLIDKGIEKKFHKKIKKYELLFRAYKDGFTASSFHQKCDGKNFTVTFVLTKNGRRFGGFTDQAWDQNDDYKKGSNGFIFSLDNNEIYFNKDSNYNIYGSSGYGPAFGGGHDFYINDSCNTNNCGENSNHSYNTNEKTYALSGSSSFQVDDYEVYQIELEK